MCDNRCVLFDNKTKDEGKRFGQVQQLLSFVNMVLSRNGGRPYTDELFTQLKVKVLQTSNLGKHYMITENSSIHSFDCRREQWKTNY